MDYPQYTTGQYHITISLWYTYDLQECIDTVVFGNKSKCEEEFAKNAQRSSLYITRDSRQSQLSSSALDTYHNSGTIVTGRTSVHVRSYRSVTLILVLYHGDRMLGQLYRNDPESTCFVCNPFNERN